jgi:thiamine transporter
MDTKTMAVCALLTAMSMALSYVTLFRMPQGGSITLFSMVPIVLAGYFYGTRRGLMVGAAVGLLNLLFGPYVIHPVQMLLDYPIAFGALAIGAPLRDKCGKASLTVTYLVGVFGRYVCAVLSGVIFFGAYAPEGFNAWTWSLWYNLTYLAVEGVITVVLLNVPQIRHAFEKIRDQAIAEN